MHKLVEHHLGHELAYELVLAAFLDGVKAAEVADRGEDGVRAVEQTNLALVVRSLGRHEEDVETGLVGRELCGH